MQKNVFYLIGGIFIGVVLTFSIIKVNGTLSGNTNTSNGKVADTNTPPSNNSAPKTYKTSIADGPILGDKNSAKVAIVEFSDYECPFCQRFHNQTFGQLKSSFMDTGKAIFVFRNYPLPFHDPAATKDAIAAECVNELGGDAKYYEMADLLYKNSGLNGKGIEAEKMVSLASGIGIDADKFTACYNSEKYKDKVAKDKQDGAASGVSGTPAFIIGKLQKDGTVSGELVSGAQPFEAFKAAIERQL